jgi:hypothetical protein
MSKADSKKYFVRYFIETPNSISKRPEVEGGLHAAWKFNIGKNEMSLYDHKYGLFSDIYLEEESLERAELESKAIVENILTFIDYSTSSASSPALLISIYDASPNLSKREFKQIIYKPISDRNIKVVKQDIFGEIFLSFDKNQETRIARAASWLRKAYLEENLIDKFIAYWTGLESINKLLCDFFEISDEDRRWICNNCGIQIQPLSLIGIKTLFINEMGVDKQIFNKIRNCRNNLLHGNIPLDDNFVNQIKKHLPLLRKALIIGIGKLLKVKNETITKIFEEKPFRYNEKIRFFIKTKLFKFEPPDLKDFGKQPSFEIVKDELLQRLVTENGRLDRKSKLGLKLINARFYGKIIVEIWADEYSSIEKIEMDKN